MTPTDTTTFDGCIAEHDPANNPNCEMRPGNAAGEVHLTVVANTPAVEAPVVTPEEATAEVALDLQAAYRNFYARAIDADVAADNLTESARGERALAVQYRAKGAVLAEHMRTLGIDVPDDVVTTRD